MFSHDWFHGQPYNDQLSEAKMRCALKHFPDVEVHELEEHKELRKFHDELEARTLLYLRDGFSYEILAMADVPMKSHLVFECMPMDESYKVGAFIVTVPFDEIVRVEVFAVHPDEQPDDMPQITGFRAFDPKDFKFRDGNSKHGNHKPIHKKQHTKKH